MPGLADAAAQVLLEAPLVETAAAEQSEREHSGPLCRDLLLEGHPTEQILDSLLHQY